MSKYIVNMVVATAFLVSANVQAELLTDLYGINIVDDKNGDIGFYQLFNSQFGTSYASSNDVFNAFGVNPNETWTVSTLSTLVGGDKNQSGFIGSLSMLNSNGVITPIATAQEVLANSTLQLGIDHAIDGNTYPAGSGISFQLDVTRNVGYESQEYTLYSGTNADNKVYMLALNITDLYNTQYSSDFDSVFMFLWEDWKDGVGVKWGSPYDSMAYTDWDYSDFIYIMTNVYIGDGGEATVPEPATLGLIGLGLAGLGLARRRTKR